MWRFCKKKGDKMTFCIAPFVHMVQNPDGHFRTCCMYEKPLKRKYKNIREAFESEENNIIRKRMLSGEKLSECNKCDIDEMHSGKNEISYRQTFNKKYDKSYIESPVFKNLEFSVSNKCNFKCIDCGPRFSNQFGPTINNDLPIREDVMHLDFLKILGGEPFLDKKNIDLLKMMPRKNMKLMLVTNNSIFPSDELLNLMDEFKYLNINLSIDGIEDIAEYVRYGTKWTRFERNFKRWVDWGNEREYCHIVPHFVLHSLNAPFFEESVEWSNIDFSWWSWDFLVSPSWLNMSYLPDHVKSHILNKNNILNKPLKDFLKLNKYNKKHFHQLLSTIDDVPDKMETYIDLFYRKL